METQKITLLAILVILVLIIIGIFLIPHYRKRKKKSQVILEIPNVDESELDDLYIGIVPDVEMRRNINKYTQIYLTDRIYKEKNQIYISKDIYDRMKRLVPLIAPDLSCSTYISNILVEHLEEYKPILRVISETNFKKTIKSWKAISKPGAQ